MQSRSFYRPAFAPGRLARLETLLILVVAHRLFLAWVLPMTDTTEARYADMARMMVETGDWITPRFDYDVPFWGKPPLHTWLSAAGIALLEPIMIFAGVDAPRDLAARLPMLGAAMVLLFVLHAWIARIRDTETAWITVVIVASSALFFGASAFVMTDMPLALGVVMAMAMPLAITVVVLSGSETSAPLRTAMGAVHHLDAVAPNARLWTLRDRIFSVEYYSDGRALPLDPEEIEGLVGDGRRDAIVVKDRSGSLEVPEGFDDLGRWTIYRLWLEREGT